MAKRTSTSYGSPAWSRAATATEFGRIEIDTRELAAFARTLGDLAEKQMPFAVAAALTDTARQARDELRKNLPKHFKVRNPSVTRGIQYKPASKRDNPPTALVHTEPWAGFLTLHVTGGVKHARGGRVAVPTRIVKRTGKGRIKKAQKPRPLRERKGLEEGKLAKGQVVVRGVRSAPKGLSIFYHLVRGARIRARWPLLQETEAVVKRELPANFKARMAHAVATARKPRQ